MNKYSIRKNFKATYLKGEQIIQGKAAFKTKETAWLDTSLPVIALVSTDSVFNEGISGHLKMNAFISTIRNNVNGEISVLIADAAHQNAQGLKNCQLSQEHYLWLAKELVHRHSSYFKGCRLLYWSSSILQDKDYISVQEQLTLLSKTDLNFRKCLLKDAEDAYTEKRRLEFPDKALFIDETIADIIMQCAAIQILAKQGYRYLFYPGPPCSSTEYTSRILIPFENRLLWIHVFLTIEKTTVMSSSDSSVC